MLTKMKRKKFLKNIYNRKINRIYKAVFQRDHNIVRIYTKIWGLLADNFCNEPPFYVLIYLYKSGIIRLKKLESVLLFK